MTIRQRWLTATLLSTTAVVLTACGGGGTDAPAATGTTAITAVEPGQRRFPDVNVPGPFPLAEPITVSVMGPHAGAAEWEDMPLWHAMTEATNIHFTFITPPQNDILQHVNLAFAAGNTADVLFGLGLTPLQQIEHGSVGTLIPLQDYIAQYAPNLTRLLAEHPHIRNSITAPDGNIYSIPAITLSFDGIWPVGPVYYNGLWMDVLGAEVPTTLDEFTALMFRFRDEMPAILGVDEVWPISATHEMLWLRHWMVSFFGMSGRGIEATDGVVVHNATTDAYRAWTEWMHMLMSERIIHPEIYTLSNDHHDALGRANLVGFFQNWHSYGFLGTDQEQALRNPMLRPIISEWSPDGVLPRSPGFSTNGALSLTSTAPNPGALIAMFDFFYSDEGALIADHGPEGFYWQYDYHAGTGERIRVMGPGMDPEDGLRRGRATPFFGFPGPNVRPVELPRVFPDRYVATIERSPFDIFMEEETLATMGVYGKVNMPPTMLLPSEADAIALINADLLLEINMREAQFITGITPINDQTWAEFQASLENIGVDTFVEVWQTAHDRWLAAAN